jgi:hypothetical protein
MNASPDALKLTERFTRISSDRQGDQERENARPR